MELGDNLYKVLFEQSPDAIVVKDPDTMLPVSFNDRILEILGYSREEFATLRITDYEAQESAEEVRSRIRKGLDQGADEFETIFRTKSGELRNVQVIVRTVTVDGKVYLHNVLRDITEQKRTEEGLRLLNDSFLRFGTDINSNINLITRAAGSIMNATCALYTRLKDGFLCSIGQWQAPADFRSESSPDGHICYDVIRNGLRTPLFIGNLDETPYAVSDPNVKRYGLKTYVGMPVFWGETAVGALCAVYDTDVTPSESELTFLAIAAAAIGVEEARWRAEEELQKEKVFVENALNNLKDTFFVIDMEGGFLRWNETISTVTGYSKEEIAAMKATDFFPEEEHPLVMNTIASVFREGYGALEGTTVTKDGRRIPYEYTGAVFKDHAGNVVGISGSGRDITERKEAENSLRASEARYDDLVRSLPLGVFAMRACPEGPKCFEYVSPRLCEILGIDRDEMLRDVRSGFAMAHPDDREKLLGDTMDAIRSLTPFRWIGRFIINGEARWVSIKSDPKVLPDGDSIWNGVVSDITERKQAEDALIASEARYRQLYESIMDAFAKVDMTGRIIEFNTAYREMLGYTAEELQQLTYVDLTPTKWHAMEARIIEEQLMIRGFSEVYEKEYIRKDGTVFPVELRTYVIREAGGEPYAMWGIVRDITKRKQMEEMVRQNEKFVRNIIDAMEYTLCVIDCDQRIVMVNKAYCEYFKVTPEEAVGRNCYSVVCGFDVPCEEFDRECPVKHTFETGEPATVVRKPVDPMADDRIIEIKSFPLKDASGNISGVIELASDITDRVRIEEHLHTVQKLESVGVLAGGIAHDFNNILTVIMGYISLVKMKEHEGSDNFESLGMAEEACRHAADLSYRLLTFTKGGAPVRTIVDIREILADTIKFALSGSNLQVKFAFRDKIPPLSLDDGQMRQVFSNLAFNARDAMPAGGLLAVKIEETVITWKDALPVPSGRYVKIVFRDHGCGIPQEIIGRIFDPYFTTKELGARKGQGLGLTICHSIIVRHGGAITVESEPGQGAAFTIYLPIAEPVAGQPPDARAMTRMEPAVSRTILVMDDEEWIRNLLGDLLKHMGHEVTTVPDSASAIEAYRTAQTAGRPFDLVILDLTIQGGPGGLATMKEILALDPAAKGVISSGYADDPAILNFRESGFVAAMAKPYTAATLQKIITGLFPG